VVLIHVLEARDPEAFRERQEDFYRLYQSKVFPWVFEEVPLQEIVFYLAFAWMTVLLVVGAAAVIRLRSTAGCILALDTLTLILIALLVLYADANRSSYYMDAALVLSLLAFVATLVLARYHEERRIF
jgi:multisubunit Na+/H+ antiporter MnhF subunit